jgi:ABC-2 type transport system ATP-binding protein
MSARDPQTPAISTRGLTKRYGSLVALNNLNLDVVQGEVLGFLGLNGAGKTTAIRLLLDLLRPTSGAASIFGHDCRLDGLAARARVGFLPGELGIYPDLTGLEVLDFLAGLRRQPVDKQRRQELVERLELPERDLRRKLRQYSTGMKRKLGVIQAFEGDPPLLILDEPTEGLDPLMQESFYALLQEAKQKGRTVFMSSHVLSEVERVCDRVALLRKGELVLLAGLEEIRQLTARRVRVTFSREVPAPAGQLAAGHEFLEIAPRVWRLEVAGPLGPLLTALAGLPVEDLEVREARLEDVLLKYYREGTA